LQIHKANQGKISKNKPYILDPDNKPLKIKTIQLESANISGFTPKEEKEEEDSLVTFTKYSSKN